MLASELARAERPALKSIILQAFAVCLYLFPTELLTVLEEQQKTKDVFVAWFTAMDSFKKDLELQRSILGLSSIFKLDVRALPETLRSGLQLIMNKLVAICELDVKQRKEEESDEEDEGGEGKAKGKGGEKGMNEGPDEGEGEWEEEEDEEDDSSYSEGEDDDWNGGYMLLYDSPLEAMDEIMHLRTVLNELAQRDNEAYLHVLGLLSEEERTKLEAALVEGERLYHRDQAARESVKKAKQEN